MKKWFWVVGCDNTTASPFVADEGDLGAYEEALNIGSEVQSWPGTAWVKAATVQQDGDPDDALQTCVPVPIFSSRLRAALEEGGITGVQYLPIRVIRPNGQLILGFSIANVLNCVDGLDLSRSAVERFPNDYFLPARRGAIRSINRPVLAGPAIDHYDIVRLSLYKAPLYVSERFVQIFEDGRFTGYSFQEITTSHS